MNEDFYHRIVVRDEIIAVRERIERILDVKTTVKPISKSHGGGWTIDFFAPKDVDLDFLRPDVLPPK